MGIIENKHKQNMMSNTYIVLALGIATTTIAVRLQSQDVFYLVEIGDWLDGAAIDIGDWTEGAFEDLGDWTEGAFEDLGDWTEGAFVDFGDWTEEAFVDFGDWTEEAAIDTGDWIKETMMKLATEEGRNDLKEPIVLPIIIKIADFLE